MSKTTHLWSFLSSSVCPRYRNDVCAPQLYSVSEPPQPIGDSVRFAPGSQDTLEWDHSIAGNNHLHDVYRGNFETSAFTYNHLCWGLGIVETQVADSDMPAFGAGFYYLVTNVNFCSESGLGVDGSGAPRPSGVACPVPSADSESDTVIDLVDNCPLDVNANQVDEDRDTVGDVCDNCPTDANPDQANGDGDTLGDVCDPSP